MQAIVRLQDVRHEYGARVALDGVSFEVEAGTCFGVLGPNGGGKTTLFRILSTLLQPTAGLAEIRGLDVRRHQDAVRRCIGVVFQSPSLDIHLTARENLRHSGHLYGLRGRSLESSIGDALEQMGVADRADDRVKALSGGLRRRVELAKCLLHRPAVLILDEPSTGLDPSARRTLWRQLESLRQSTGLTTLLTTHFMEEADRCDALAILDRGRLVACGAPHDLKARVGGDCIVIDCADAADLARRIRERFDCPATVVDGRVRMEHNEGASFVGQLAKAFGAELRSVTVGQPTLEDVFMRETGHGFDGDNADDDRDVASGQDDARAAEHAGDRRESGRGATP